MIDSDSIDSAFYYLAELQDSLLCDIYQEWIDNKGKTGVRQTWSIIPANTLVKEWEYNLKTGNTHYKIIEKIEKIVIQNYVKLYINTVLFGHDSLSPYDFAESVIPEDMTQEEFDSLFEDFEYFACDESGAWRISDFALDKIGNYAMQLLQTNDSNKKLYLIDCILNIVHQRSQLASWFVEGGNKTLNRLSGEIQPL